MFEVKEGLDDRNKDQGDFFNLKKKQLLIKMTMILKALVPSWPKCVSKVSKIHRKGETGNCLGTMGNTGLTLIQP